MNNIDDLMDAHPEGKFGWVPPDDRTEEQQEAHTQAVMSMPLFRIVGSYMAMDKVFLWEFEKQLNGGNTFDALFQEEGSCVCQGYMNALLRLGAIEIARNGDREVLKRPFGWMAYAESRRLGGLRGNGSGSFGSTMAVAAVKVGAPAIDLAGLPQPYMHQLGQGLTWGSRVELAWSDVNDIDPKWFEEAKKYTVATAAKMNSAEDVKQALMNGYPCTTASNWGGAMKCRVVEGVLLNARQTVWQHQQCIIGYWAHPVLGDIYYILNSWGNNAHGKCPTGAPLGGYWVKKNEIEYIVRQGETFALSSFNGYPAQDIEKYLFRIL